MKHSSLTINDLLETAKNQPRTTPNFVLTEVNYADKTNRLVDNTVRDIYNAIQNHQQTGGRALSTSGLITELELAKQGKNPRYLL